MSSVLKKADKLNLSLSLGFWRLHVVIHLIYTQRGILEIVYGYLESAAWNSKLSWYSKLYNIQQGSAGVQQTFLSIVLKHHWFCYCPW